MSPSYTLEELRRLRSSDLTVFPPFNIRRMIDGWLPKPVLLPPAPQTPKPKPKLLDPTTPPYNPKSTSRVVEKFDTSALREKYPSATVATPRFPRWNYQPPSKENIVPARQTDSAGSSKLHQPQNFTSLDPNLSKSKKDPKVLISLEDSGSDTEPKPAVQRHDSMFTSVLAQLNFPQEEMSSVVVPHFERNIGGEPCYFPHLCFQQKFLKLSPEEIRLKEQFPEPIVQARVGRPPERRVDAQTAQQSKKKQPENLLDLQDEVIFQSPTLKPSTPKSAHTPTVACSSGQPGPSEMPSKRKKGKEPQRTAGPAEIPLFESTNHGKQPHSVPQHVPYQEMSKRQKQYASPERAPLDASAFQSAMKTKGLDLGSSKHAPSLSDAASQIPEPLFTKRDGSEDRLARSNAIFDKKAEFPLVRQKATTSGTPLGAPWRDPGPRGPPTVHPVPTGPTNYKNRNAVKAPTGPANSKRVKPAPPIPGPAHVQKVNAIPPVNRGPLPIPKKAKGPASRSLNFTFNTEIPNFRKENSDFHQSTVRVVSAPTEPIAENEEPEDGGSLQTDAQPKETPRVVSPAESSSDDQEIDRATESHSACISDATTETGAVEKSGPVPDSLVDNSMQLSIQPSTSADMSFPEEPLVTISEGLTVAGQELGTAHEAVATKEHVIMCRYAFRAEEGRWPESDSEIIAWSEMFQSSVAKSDNQVSFEDLEAICFCFCPSAIQAREEALEISGAPALYPFFFRLVKQEWPSTDGELVDFSREVREQMTPDDEEDDGANLHDLEGFESYAFCDCETAKEVRVQMQNGSMFGADSDGLPPHNCEKFTSQPATASEGSGKFSKLFGRMSSYAGHYKKEHRRVWFSNTKK